MSYKFINFRSLGHGNNFKRHWLQEFRKLKTGLYIIKKLNNFHVFLLILNYKIQFYRKFLTFYVMLSKLDIRPAYYMFASKILTFSNFYIFKILLNRIDEQFELDLVSREAWLGSFHL